MTIRDRNSATPPDDSRVTLSDSSASSETSRPSSNEDHIAAVSEALSRVRGNIRQISTAPQELWVIFVLKFFTSYAYFTWSLVLTLYLSREFGLSDMDAGWAYGTYGVMSTLFGIACGWIIDFLGVRKSLMLGSAITSVSRVIITFTTSRNLTLALLFIALPFGESLGIPILTIGVKRYTNATNRTFGYALFYSTMNVAGFVAGPIVDSCRAFFSEGVHVTLPYFGVRYLSDLRFAILTSACASISFFVVTLLFMRDVELDESGNILEFEPNRSNVVSSTWSALKDRAFWRLALLTFLLVAVRLVFGHNSATLPKYLIRQFGEDAPFGMVFAINPLLIIFLVPLTALVTKHMASFPMILYGSILAAASPLLICIDQSYLMISLYMVVLSLGEAVYSPRVYEYSMELSARGSEGLYSSLASAPLFTIQFVVGGMSGWLLSAFMPKGGPYYGKMVWGIIGLTSLASPALMFIFRNFIENDKKDSSDTEDENDRLPNVEDEQQPLVTAKS